MTTNIPEVDWSKIVQYPEDTIECRCGQCYKSHCKGISHNNTFTMVTRKPCPKCNETIGHVRRASSDPEVMVIKK